MKAWPFILLAPSEEKEPGGATGLLEESPAQRWVRERLVRVARQGTSEALARAFAVKDRALGKARSEALALGGEVPLLPALARYSGVAYKALAAASLSPMAWRHVYILSVLRGLIRGDDLVPPYKLKLNGFPGLKAHWTRALASELGNIPQGHLWELLPQDSAELIRAWDRPRHRVEILDARGKAVSHFSKLHRGRLAHWLLAHQEGDPRKLLRAELPGCQWAGAEDNETGGLTLRMVVEP
jgi:hypothetical protein